MSEPAFPIHMPTALKFPPKAALLLLAAGLLPAAAAAPAPAAAGVRPNIVFILADDLGWTDTHAFGSDLYETPNLDRLAREGMSFDQAYAACNVCSPTRASILTGQYPARLHVTDWIAGYVHPHPKLRVPDWTMHLDPAVPNLAQTLRAAGYATGHFGKWHLGDEPYWPEHQGFDVNVGGWSAGSPFHRNGAGGYFSPYGNPRLPDGPPGEHLDLRLAREAVSFIEAHKQGPFFVNLWLYDVHMPLQAEPAQREHFRALVKEGARHRDPTYASMVAKMDEAAGIVLAALERLGLADNTIVVFTSDNGGLLRRRGGPETAPTLTSNAPLRAGKGSVYEGGVRVPLTVRWPKHVPANVWCHTPVISVDYFPTLLALTGVARPTGPCDGVNIAPLFAAPTATLPRDALFWHYPHYHVEGAVPHGAIRKGDWRLIENYETGACELYNLATDIGERHDLSATEPAKTAELLAQLRAWREQVGAQMPTPATGDEPQRRRRTRAQEE